MATIFKSAVGVFQSAYTKQADLATVQAVDTQHVMGASWNPPVPVATTVSDAGFTNGAEGATTVETVTKHFTGAFQFDRVYPNSIGSMLAYTFGPPATSTVDTSGVQHIFSDTDTDRVLDAFTTEYSTVAAGSENLKFRGCLVQSFTISMTKNQPMTLTVNWVGVARSADGTGATTVITTEPSMLGHGVTAWLGTGVEDTFVPVLGTCDLSGETELSGTTNAWLQSFNLTVTNIPDVTNLYTFTDDEISRAIRGARTVTGDFTIDKEAETIPDYIQANTEFAIEVDWTSGTIAGATAETFYYGAEFVVPKAHIVSEAPSWGADGRQTATYNFEALEGADDNRFLGVVNNKTAAYAATPA